MCEFWRYPFVAEQVKFWDQVFDVLPIAILYLVEKFIHFNKRENPFWSQEIRNSLVGQKFHRQFLYVCVYRVSTIYIYLYYLRCKEHEITLTKIAEKEKESV